MNSPSTQFISSGMMGMYEPIHQFGMWGEPPIKTNGITSPSMFIAPNPNSSQSLILPVETKLENQSEDTSQTTLGPSGNYDQETTKPIDKIQRRLAQNREAARKSRLRKKAYVQQLESSRQKLIQLEQELKSARQQGLYIGGVDSSSLGFSGPINPGIATFEIEYKHWLQEQNKLMADLRTALNADASEIELHMLVESGTTHYTKLFSMKATAAKADVFYMMSGMFKSSAERFFLWIGGFRPSELLKILKPQLDPLTKQQLIDGRNLKQTCQQAEDALSQGMEKLQQTLAEAVADGRLGEPSHMPQVDTAMEKLEGLVRFVQQADHLRQIALQQMMFILTTRQAAQGLLALGEYFQKLRALSSICLTHSHEPA